MTDKTLRINIKQKTSLFQVLPKGFFYLDRTLFESDSAPSFRTYPLSWCFIAWEADRGTFAIHTKNGELDLAGSQMAIIPAHQLVKWEVKSTVRYHAIISTHPNETLERLNTPIVVPKNFTTLPESTRDIKKILDQIGNYTSIEYKSRINSIAFATKRYIDQNFHKPLRIQDIAKELGISREGMTRNFCLTYGLSPVEYRMNLRIMAAKHYILIDRCLVDEAAQRVGYSNMAFFREQFEKVLGVTPGNFKNGS